MKKLKKLFALLCVIAILLCGSLNVAFATSAPTFSLAVPEDIECGEIFEITVNVSAGNNAVDCSNVNIFSPSMIAIVDDMDLGVVSAGDTKNITVRAIALEGGSEDIYLIDAQNAILAKCEVVVSGAGWYAGDSHSHTVFSDGSTNVGQNAMHAIEIGHDFLYATDHDTMTQRGGVYNFRKNPLSKRMLVMTGYEKSNPINDNSNHAVVYNVPIIVGSNTKSWVSVTNEVSANGGLIYIAHPYQDGHTWDYKNLYEEAMGFTGIEIVNSSDVEAEYNVRSQKYWDKINTTGAKKWFAISNSDAHVASRVGESFNKGYFSELSETEVNKMFALGTGFCSNGIDIRFEIGGIGMGGTIKVDGETQATVTVKASDRNYALESVTLYEYKIEQRPLNGSLEDIDVQPSNTWSITLTQNQHYAQQSFDVVLKPNHYYRMEARSERGLIVSKKGYAFSNPIWVEQVSSGELPNYAPFSAINSTPNLTVGEYISCPWDGGYIFNGFDNEFDKTNATVDGAQSLAYTKGGDNKAGILTATFVAEDGTTYNKSWYVVDSVSITQTENDDPEPPVQDDPVNPPQEDPTPTQPSETGCASSVNNTSVFVCIGAVLLFVYGLKIKFKSE